MRGLLLWQETADPWVLHDASGQSDFDRGCFLAITSEDVAARNRMTPDANVYTRLRSSYSIRRLYRSDLPQAFTALFAGERADFFEALTPPGRFSAADIPISVLPESGRTVSFVFNTTNETQNFEANGSLKNALSYPERAPMTVMQTFDCDDYGSRVSARDYGIIGGGSDDEKFIATTYARGGEALSRWILDRPSEETTTDENGKFVTTKRHYYDGDAFVGLPLGQLGSRGLNHRTTALVNGAAPVPALSEISDALGDPRLPAGKEINMERVEFDAYGNVLTIADPLAVADFSTGHRRRHVFDSKFQIYCVEDRILLENGHEDLVFRGKYDYTLGLLTEATKFNGYVSKYTHDSFSRLVKSVQRYDSDAFPTMVYECIPADVNRGRVYHYDAAGNLTVASETQPASRVVSRQREIAGQPGQHVSLKFFDGANRCIGAIGEGDKPGHWLALNAGSFNRRMQSSRDWLPYDINYGGGDADYPGFINIWPNGRPPAEDAQSQAVVSHDSYYDHMGRVLMKVLAPTDYNLLADPKARKRSITRFLPFEGQSYDENDSDPESPHYNTPVIRKTDGLGRLVESTETSHLADDGTTVASVSSWVTRFRYNLLDLPIQVTDSLGNVKAFRYDGLGRKIFLNDPDRGSLTLTYDDASNQLESMDAGGQRLVATFDGVNRMLTEDYPDEASPNFSYHRSPDVRYHFDVPAGAIPKGDGTLVTGANTKGRIAWIEDTAGEEHYSYDERGRSTNVVRRLPDIGMALPSGMEPPLVSYSTAQEYDSFDRLVRFIYPDNDELRQEFGPRNLVARVLGGPTGFIISKMDYFAHGRARRIEYGDGVVTTFTHDPRLRLRSLVTRSSGSAPTNALIDFSYTYDGACNLMSIEDRRPPEAHPAGSALRNTQTFGYDALYRLTQVRYGFGLAGETNRDDGVVRYCYDRIGNLVVQESGLQQYERNLLVTDLGSLSYGGSAGTSNRADGL